MFDTYKDIKRLQFHNANNVLLDLLIHHTISPLLRLGIKKARSSGELNVLVASLTKSPKLSPTNSTNNTTKTLDDVSV